MLKATLAFDNQSLVAQGGRRLLLEASWSFLAFLCTFQILAAVVRNLPILPTAYIQRDSGNHGRLELTPTTILRRDAERRRRSHWRALPTRILSRPRLSAIQMSELQRASSRLLHQVLAANI